MPNLSALTPKLASANAQLAYPHLDFYYTKPIMQDYEFKNKCRHLTRYLCHIMHHHQLSTA